jgi:hypothetical protein
MDVFEGKGESIFLGMEDAIMGTLAKQVFEVFRAPVDEEHQAPRPECGSPALPKAVPSPPPPDPIETDDVVAVKVFSPCLDSALWVVADNLPCDAWPTDAPVYQHAEVKRLSGVGKDLLVGVHMVKELFAVRLLAVTCHSRPSGYAGGRWNSATVTPPA